LFAAGRGDGSYSFFGAHKGWRKALLTQDIEGGRQGGKWIRISETATPRPSSGGQKSPATGVT